MARILEYTILDVFAEQPLAGNPLAVFHDARTLTSDEMQALARETNLSETTFILPADEVTEEANGVRVRIFTTDQEFPFAGHPTLGTATWLYLNHPTLRGADTITLHLNVGPIPVTFAPSQSESEGIVATMRQNDPAFGNEHDPAEVAALLGLSADDMLSSYAPQTVSTGLPFCIVPLRSIDAVQRMNLAQRDSQSFLERAGAKYFYVIAPIRNEGAEDANAAAWHARMQFNGADDPATGSAAGCCISWLVRHGLAQPDTDLHIEQGMEVRRPSRLTVRASLAGGKVSQVLVLGRTIPVATGRFFLP